MKRLYSIIAILLLVQAPVAYSFFATKKSPPKDFSKSLWVELSGEEQVRDRINQPSYAPLIKKAEAAVLVVTTESVVKQPRYQIPPELEGSPFQDFFRFFGPPPGTGPELRAKGQGSGFIINPLGYGLTNAHVVSGASKIIIKAGSDPKEYEGEVVGVDEQTDVALIKIKTEKKDWPTIPLGNSDSLQVGDFAVAIGNPLGLELSAASGMVSARGRRNIHPSGRDGLYDFIQIDAPINPGNSGGPLINLAGEAVGINTAISAAGQGIAFAIPINQVKQILSQLKEKGKVARSWLGLKIQEVDSDIAKAMGLKYPHGALIREVVPEGPAAKAGLEAGDVVTEFDGKSIKDASSLQFLSALTSAGKTVDIVFFRDSAYKTVKVTLEEMPRQDKLSKTKSSNEAVSVEGFGLVLTNLDDTTRKQLKLDKMAEGALVAQVAEQSPAAMVGIEPNDLIIKVNGKSIKSAQSVVEALKEIPAGNMVKMFIRRGRSTIFVAMVKT